MNVSRPLLLAAGIELSEMVRNENPLNIWLPDLFLTTGKDVSVLDETIRLRPGGVMFWSRHVVATIQENGFRKCISLSAMAARVCVACIWRWQCMRAGYRLS